jgi:type IX secretion system PorP/SprF family membrane protein
MGIKYLHNKNIFYILFTLSLIFTEGVNLCAQQEGNSTLFMYNPLIVNPGAAGMQENTRYMLSHRSQWIGFRGAPMMQSLSVSTPAFSDRLGFGASLQNRRIGIIESQTVTMAWAYSLVKTEKFNCRTGLQGVVKRTALHFNDLEEAAQFASDRSVNTSLSSKLVSNFGLGIYMTYKDAFLGFSIPSYLPNVLGVNPFSETTAAESAHYYGQGGFRFKFTEGVKIQPSVMVKWVQGVPWSLDANMSMIVKEKIQVGISYRTGKTSLSSLGESADLTFSLQVNDQLNIGFAYDWLLGPVSKYSYGSAEALIRYDIVKKKEVVFSNPRAFF